MAKATWKGEVIAESAEFKLLEGNVYFPSSAVKKERLRASDTHTTCPWKGVANYYDIVVGDEVNRDAAWYYSDPKDAASQIRDHVAFWHGVEVV